MVGRLRAKLTYANVMSSLAVFLVLGGATAFAATSLSKNSVGTKQLKNNAVTTAKIKNKAITTPKIKNGAVTGAKVNLSTLGTVPSASHASDADKATSATSADKPTTAGDAAKLDGLTSTAFATSDSVFKPGFAKLAAGQSALLGNSGPFALTAKCTDVGGGEVDARLLVESTEAGSLVAWGTNSDPGGTFATPMEFDMLQGAGAAAGLGATFAVVSPSGIQLNGLLNFGVNEFGADCFVGVTGVSSAG